MTAGHPPEHPDEHPEVHPEEWLDLALGGRLMPAERALLDRHLAICAACAAQLKLVESPRSAGASASSDQRLDQWAVERAVARLAYRPSVRWWRASPRLGWALAAVLLLLATGVSAKLWIAKGREAAGRQPDQPAAAAKSQPRARAARGGAVEAAPEAAPESITPRAALPMEPQKPVELSQAHQSPQLTAAALFARARELGRQGKLDAALTIHLRLQRLYPNSAEAGLSSALAGRFLLDRDRPAEALAQFDRHLARGGAADEEALAGRAVSLEHLGRHAEERTAWRALLERHPGSVYADRARVRLRDLSAR